MKLRAFDVCFRAAQRGYTADEIRPCLTVALGSGFFDVDVDHPAYPKAARDGYTPPKGLREAATAMLNELGVKDLIACPPYRCGTELKAILKDWLGIEASPTCSCSSMARRMDALGPDWCESDQGMTQILDVMRAEHAKRWGEGLTVLPWADAGARQLVLLACRRSRAEADKNSG
jgi:hypothetical protein